MLSLSRKRAQSILIGVDLLKVIHIMKSGVHVDIHLEEGVTKTVRLIEGDSFSLREGKVYIHAIGKNLVRFGFDYPEHISIMRTEILRKTPEQKLVKPQNVVELPQVTKNEDANTVFSKKRKIEVLELLSKFSPKKLSYTIDSIADDIRNIA
jgi:sRNA-binding carbon storage regulator CsrA